MSETGKMGEEDEGASLKQVSSLLACAIPTAYVNLLFEVWEFYDSVGEEFMTNRPLIINAAMKRSVI